MTRLRTGQILMAVGFVSLIFGAWAGAQYRTATALRLFFVEPFGMAAGEDGRLYVGVDRREVHAYTDSGQPVGAWTVASDAGRFRLRVRADGHVEVAREQPGEWILYTGEGVVVERHDDRDAFARFGAQHDTRVTTPDGRSFELTDAGLVRVRADERQLIAAVPEAPLAWLGSRPVRALTGLLFVGTMGLIGGAVLAVSVERSARPVRGA